MSNHFSADNLKFPGDDARLDLTDLFVFASPGDPGKTVLIIDSNLFLTGSLFPGLQAEIHGNAFHPDAVYRIKARPAVNDGRTRPEARGCPGTPTGATNRPTRDSGTSTSLRSTDPLAVIASVRRRRCLFTSTRPAGRPMRGVATARPFRGRDAHGIPVTSAVIMKVNRPSLGRLHANAALAPIGASAAAARLPTEGQLPSLGGATGWLNSPPLTAAGLRGNVVLIDFWTYTCINWLRTLPYVRAWAGKYRDQGLVVIGVHTPEFSFEGNVDNVRRAAAGMQVGYPIAIDNDYAVWRAFRNQYWPALYFADSHGNIRHHQFGEGEYETSERIIQQLLAEAGSGGTDDELVSVDARGAEAAADWASLESPENYVGYERTENFVSPGGLVPDQRHVYAVPVRLPLNHWALSGDWTAERQATTLTEAGGQIAYRFHARDLHLVMGPATLGTSVRFRVLIDGQPPGAAHGTDVDDHGHGTVTEQRLHQLVRQRGPVTDRTFEIDFLDPGVQAYVFTFG